MSQQPAKAGYVDQCLKPDSFIYWQKQIYQIEHPDEVESDPLMIWVKNIETAEVMTIRVEALLRPEWHDTQAAPLFAPTLERLQQELNVRYLPPPPVAETGLPDNLLQKAETIVTAVESVAHWVQEKERLALLQGQKLVYVKAIKQACAKLKPPIGLTAYYKYRRLYHQNDGDRVRLAAALRRSTFNQSRMNRSQLHFIDTLILRYYAGQRTVRPRPQMLYQLAGSILDRTGNLWLDPDKCPASGVENVVEELLDYRLPIQLILDNPEKADWLATIKLPSRSWFYSYLRWFEAQPEQGKAVVVARYGPEMWEREHMTFDTFVHRAVRPLEYVFADHWLLDLFIVDEATRSRLNRLWLTLLIDAYSRSVLGMSLVYETPSIASIQSALKHAIWPKVSHQELGIERDWVCYGIPQQLYLDNAWAHHSVSLEKLARGISQQGRYTSIDLVFRPPYCGRYGALIERLFGNFSGQLKELLPEAIASSDPKHVRNAARQARLLYQDVNTLMHQLIIRYQETPHRDLEQMTPHQKWLEGWQLGYPGQVPPLTQAVDRLFWRRSPETRVINRKGISAFGLNYWSPELDLAPRKGLNGKPMRYEFSYDSDDISRLALFSQDQVWVGDVTAKQLRRADGSSRPVSLWERKMAQDLARDRGQASQDWLAFVTEIHELGEQRLAEKKRAGRKRAIQPVLTETGAQGPATEQDYTDLLINFIGESASELRPGEQP